LFLGYLYGIKSEVKLAQMVNENIAFKWFLGLKLTENRRLASPRDECGGASRFRDVSKASTGA
ncbi:MAG: transposase, partial [Clostridiales bacterium]|nr:transposase [Clostridiales bacterium]